MKKLNVLIISSSVFALLCFASLQAETLNEPNTPRAYNYATYILALTSLLLTVVLLLWACFTRSRYIKRLNAKRAFKEQLVFMQEVVDSIPHPIYVRDLDRRLILCNRSYLKIFHCDKDELLDRTALDISDRIKEMPEIDQDYMRAMNEVKSFDEDRRIHIDGEAKDIYHWFQPIKNEHSQVQGIVGGWIDVSERVKLMEELTLAKDMADSASKAKTQFLATISHEIRTPMNAIIGLLELSMKRAKDNEFDFDSIRVAHDSAKGLLELIGDILDVVRIEAGQLSLNPVEVDLKQTLESAIRIFEGIASQKGLTLTLNFDDSLPKYVLLDPLRVKQILSNLIVNAIKFSDHGRITVTALKKEGSDCKAALILRVTDTGIGIPVEEQKKLFQPFAQVHNGAHNKGGTGLGLVICRSLCDMMGGSISLMSEPGQGTCISMTIPLSAIEELSLQSNQQECDAEHLKSAMSNHLLIVDDHPANRLLLSEQLKYLGHTVEEAASGQEALELLKQRHYRVVITDCNMPEMDGYELTRKLRKLEKDRSLCPAIVLGYTANAQLEVKHTCIEAGMDDCLFKPTNLKELGQKLDNYSRDSNYDKLALSFSPSALAHLADGNSELIEQLLVELLNTNETDLAQLQTAVHNGALDQAKSIAHKIKGVARIIEAITVVKGCEQLEQAESIESACEQLTKLSVVVTHLAIEIRGYLARKH